MLLSACALLSSCTEHEHEKEEEVKYLVTSPLKADTTVTKDYVCQIRAIRHIEMRAQQRGYIENIYVDEGQSVREGQVMFQIMPKLYEAELQKAQAEASFVGIEYKNTKRLADSNVVAPNELAMVNAKLDKAKAEVALAQVHLGFTKIKAPFSGIMDHFKVRLGSLVDEGDLLTTLSDNSKMWVYFNVPESEYLDYKAKHTDTKKMQVKLRMANNELFDSPGVVETIEADFDNETGNIAFRATFPNAKGLLRHGETGNIEMTVPLRNALIIPQKATFEILEKKYVYVVGKDNKVHSREVTVAAEMPDLYVIGNGLQDGERILLEGIRKVKDGDQIKFEYESPQSVIPKLKVYAE